MKTYGEEGEKENYILSELEFINNKCNKCNKISSENNYKCVLCENCAVHCPVDAIPKSTIYKNEIHIFSIFIYDLF